MIVSIGFGLPRLLSTDADAASQPAQNSSTEPEPIALGPALARLAGSMVLVCGLCVIAVRFANRKSVVAEGPLQTLASIRVNARCVIHLAQAGERRMLLGMDAGGIKAVLELPPAMAPEPDVIPMPTSVRANRAA